MRYLFTGHFVIEPVRFAREDREKRSEDNFDFSHHVNPLRNMGDILRMRVEVDAPSGMTDEQKDAFERAMNRMSCSFRRFIAEEFENLELRKFHDGH